MVTGELRLPANGPVTFDGLKVAISPAVPDGQVYRMTNEAVMNRKTYETLKREIAALPPAESHTAPPPSLAYHHNTNWGAF